MVIQEETIRVAASTAVNHVREEKPDQWSLVEVLRASDLNIVGGANRLPAHGQSTVPSSLDVLMERTKTVDSLCVLSALEQVSSRAGSKCPGCG